MNVVRGVVHRKVIYKSVLDGALQVRGNADARSMKITFDCRKTVGDVRILRCTRNRIVGVMDEVKVHFLRRRKVVVDAKQFFAIGCQQ